MFAHYLTHWNLIPDGKTIVTPRAQLLPVRQNGEAAMLKVSTDPEERMHNKALAWWDGQGSARVLEIDDTAILMERALGKRSLAAYSLDGRDDEATHILCDAIATLHTPHSSPSSEHIPLSIWFRDLEPAAKIHGDILPRCHEIAQLLLNDQREPRVLHGDVHHDNVLDFEDRGWLAIDPKGLYGDRAFDYANIFCNPDMENPSQIVTMPERFPRRLKIVSEKAGIDRKRMLQWIVAWTGLSAGWIMNDGDDPVVDLRVANLAIAELDR